MSRRRRFVIRYSNNTADDDGFNSTTRQPPPVPDARENELRLFRKRTVLHPILTNYGPESLQCFLHHEIEKLKNSDLEEQRRMIVEYAKYLVNNPRPLRIIEDDATRNFAIVPNDGSRDRAESTSISKGKTPLRRSTRRKSLINAAECDNTDRKNEDNSTIRGLLGTLTPSKRQPGKSKLPNPSSTTRSRNLGVEPAKHAVDDVPSAGSGRRNIEAQSPRLIDNALNSIDLNQSVPHPVPRSSVRTTRQQSISKPQPHTRQNSRQNGTPIDNGLDTFSSSTLHSDKGSASLPTSFNPVPAVEISSSSRQLTRASSFETYADHSREIGRTRDKACISSGQRGEESRRRRKTPTQSNGRPSLLTPSTLPLGHWLSQESTEARGFDSIMDEEFHDTREPSQDPASVLSDPELTTSAPDDLVLPPWSPPTQAQLDALMREAQSVELETDTVDRALRMKAQRGKNTDIFAEQQAILASFKQPLPAKSQKTASTFPNIQEPADYNYSQIVPEELPRDFKQAAVNRRKIWAAHGHDKLGKSPATAIRVGPFTAHQLDPRADNLLNDMDEFGDYNRHFALPSHRIRLKEPPFCRPPTQIQHSLPHEIWEAGVLDYLSSHEVRTLRLVCKRIAEDLEPYVFRNVVTNFDPSFFSIHPSVQQTGQGNSVASMAMLEKFGPGINKFGISFEYDQWGMTNAPFKVTETTVDAWFGHYKWPVKDYPYFAPLKEIDTLLDDQPRLLIHAMRNLTSCHELALSVDSGHGWLNGPDLSDLAVYRERVEGGTKVFGKTFSSTDRAYEDGLRELFEWAQRNTINENIKHYEGLTAPYKENIERLQDVQIRQYESYETQDLQPDDEKDLHTGRVTVVPIGQPNNPIPVNGLNPFNPPIIANAQMGLHVGHGAVAVPTTPHMYRAAHLRHLTANRTGSPKTKEKVPPRIRTPIQPQWPIIYSGYNISADVDGSDCVQARISDPSECPLMPGVLTEAQAQWLMETSWIQRTFLTSYTDAIRSNASVFKNVHSLHVSKMSSGLLSSLTPKTFWLSLPNLRTLSIFVKPDWRVEHVPGDKLYRNTMTAKLIDATLKFTQLLRNTIARIESINDLHIGYCSGGEHQRGIFGRNQHVLPAPIVMNPREWLLAQNPANPRPEEDTMFTFPHVRNLKFENCWFSPMMLEMFMQKSQDSSLHNLTLDSVSLTSTVNSARTDGPLRTYDHQLRCLHPEGAWLQEIIPANASWVHVLDRITTGRTMLDQKYNAGMINEEDNPRPEAQFRGNTQSINLKSCGYVKVQGVSNAELNQNDLVLHSIEWSAFDDGLRTRAGKFTKTIYVDGTGASGDTPDDNGESTMLPPTARVQTYYHPTQPNQWRTMRPPHADSRAVPTTTISQFIMQGGQTAVELLHGSHNTLVSGFDLTGFLTQCIHPVEKRILEQNWGMQFGWGNDMTRWEAVEDGWFMGGTGRFSGTVYKDSKLQDAVNAARLQQMTKNEVDMDLKTNYLPLQESAPAYSSATATGRADQVPLPNTTFGTDTWLPTCPTSSTAGPSQSRPQAGLQATYLSDLDFLTDDQPMLAYDPTFDDPGDDNDEEDNGDDGDEVLDLNSPE